MDRQIPNRVGGHGMSGQVNAGRIDVGPAGGIENRLHHQIHSDRAGAVKLIEIQQRHQDDGIGMVGKFARVIHCV